MARQTKLLCTSDWQVELNNLDRSQIMLSNFLNIIRDEKPSAVLHLGDLKEAFNPVDQRVTNFLVSAFAQIRQLVPHTIALLGNHDKISTQAEVENCFPAIQHTGTRTVEEAETIQYGSIAFHCLPFSRNNDWIQEQIKSFATRKGGRYNFLLFHNDIAECQYAPGRKGGGLPLKAMMAKHFDLCIGGHVHYHQKLGSNVWYVGSPFCMDWGEANQVKGHMLVSITEGKGIQVRQIPGGLPGWYDPALPNFPQRKDWNGATIRLRVDCGSKDPRADILKATQTAERQYAGAHIHVVPEFGRKVEVPEDLRLEGEDKVVISDYLNTLRQQMKKAGIQKQDVLNYILERLPAGASGLRGLRLHRVEAENVLCYETAKLDLTRPGLTMVTGINHDWGRHSNGSGKSTLLSLPLLALFGRTPKGQTHDNWKRKGAKRARLTLSFKLPDGKQCLLTRTRPAGTVLEVAGKDMTMGKIGDTQQAIEQVTGLTWDVLVNSIYLGQPDASTLLRGTPKERKELFSRFLGLNRYLQTQETARQDANKVKAELQVLAVKLADADARIAEVARAYKEFKLPQRITQADIAQLKTKAAGMLALKRKAATADRKARDASQQLDVTMRPLMENTARASMVFEAALKELRKYELSMDKGPAVCPTCGQTVGEKFSSDWHKKLRLQRHKAERKFNAARVELAQYDELLKAARAKEETTRKAVFRAQERHKEAARTVKEARNARAVYLQAKAQKAELGGRRARYRTAKAKLKTKRTQLEQQTNFLSFCAMVAGRDGVPAYLCARAAPALNNAAARYSEAFSGGEIQVRFRLDAGDLDVDVMNAHGGERVEDQSTGEARMASLVSLFAMRDVLVPMGILILDEPGEGLDAMNAQAFAAGLGQVVKRFGSVYLTTHNPHIIGAVEADRSITVEKRDGVARIKEEQ